VDDRIEADPLGTGVAPDDALWGPQTELAIRNFPVSGRPLPVAVVRNLAMIKAEAARANGLDPEIAAAAEEIVSGKHDDQFPVDAFQTGSGTSTNMNVNEVIARIATAHRGRPVHPNDDVNRGQSSNDVFPSAVHMAAAAAVVDRLFPAARGLAAALRAKAAETTGVVKSGRTHLMDAVPVTLGQELGGYAAQIDEGVERLEDALPRLGALPLGGTAVGSGLNAAPGFAPTVIAALARRTGLPLTEARNHFAAQGARDALVETSGQLRALAIALVKIANDLRWMASGPRAGLAEIRLPALQPGSSIMPGKVNPVIPEVVAQVGAQVIGNDAAIAFAGSQGAFELNAFVPVMARNLLESIDLLAAACALLAERCVAGIEADIARSRAGAESSPAIATVLAPRIGYDKTAEVVDEAARTGESIRAVVVRRGLLPAAEADRLLDVDAMARGGGGATPA